MDPVTLNAAISKVFTKTVGGKPAHPPHDLRSTARSYFRSAWGRFPDCRALPESHSSALAQRFTISDYIDERRLALEKWSALLVGYEHTAQLLFNEEVV